MGSEVIDDRARERRPDAWNTHDEPAHDPLRRLRQRGAEGHDGELPAVSGVLGERAGAKQLLARAGVAERAGKRDRNDFVTTVGRRPDGEFEVGRHVARPRLGERHGDLARIAVERRRWLLYLPDGLEDTFSRRLATAQQKI